ncbi:hypothetical protein DDD63_10560 [Actinobaculum sp. 313]|nr:hypothetical protein DDD63_10560 [Actinobaculum sp. 313]
MLKPKGYESALRGESLPGDARKQAESVELCRAQCRPARAMRGNRPTMWRWRRARLGVAFAVRTMVTGIKAL